MVLERVDLSSSLRFEDIAQKQSGVGIDINAQLTVCICIYARITVTIIYTLVACHFQLPCFSDGIFMWYEVLCFVNLLCTLDFQLN